MSTKFPRAAKSTPGYDVEQVEAFLEEARRAYGADASPSAKLTAERIRHTAFAMRKGGYETAPVDEALERLEDAFAGRERAIAVAARGKAGWNTESQTAMDEIVARLTRPSGERFQRVGILVAGYHRADVDLFADRLTRDFQEGIPVAIEEVRSTAFRAQRGGYREAQVDLVLDAVIDVLHARGA